MQLGFNDEVILVTGASSGIGAASAQGFAALGARTVLHYNSNEDGVRATQQAIEDSGGTASTLRADLSSGGSAAAMVDKVV